MLLQRLLKFGLTGGLATVTHVLLVWIGVEYLGWSATLATLPAFLIALLLSYALNHRWTFQAQGRHDHYFPRFATIAVGGLILNGLIMYSLTERLHLPYPWALLVIVLVIPLFSFILNHYWTFNPQSSRL